MTGGDISLPQERARCGAKIASDLEQMPGPVFFFGEWGGQSAARTSWKEPKCKILPGLVPLSDFYSLRLLLCSRRRTDASSSQSSSRPCPWLLGEPWTRSCDVRQKATLPCFCWRSNDRIQHWRPCVTYERVMTEAVKRAAARRRFLAIMGNETPQTNLSLEL